jgi:hypothetical protein
VVNTCGFIQPARDECDQVLSVFAEALKAVLRG